MGRMAEQWQEQEGQTLGDTKTLAEALAAATPRAYSMGVYRAIASVTGRLAEAGIGKSRKNEQQGYKFRGIDDVYNALSRPIADAGLCLLPRVLRREITERTTQKGNALFYVVVDVEFDLVCAEDGSQHTVRVIGEAMDTGDKATNKAMSAAYKYMAMQVFCIPTEGDNDADATTHVVAARLDPMDRENLSVTAEHGTYADAFRAALESGNDLGVIQCADDTNAEGEEFYRAVWSLLNSKERAAISATLKRIKSA